MARLYALRPRVIFAGSGISALLEPSTTLSTTTEFAYIVGCTFGTCSPWIARGVDFTRGGSSRNGGSCCSGSTGASQEALYPRMLKLFSRTSTLPEPTTPLSTTSSSASIVGDTLRTREGGAEGEVQPT